MNAHLLPYFLVLLLTALSGPASTQSLPADAPSARQLLLEAQVLLDSSRFQSAEEKAESAYNFFNKNAGESPADLAQSAYLTGLAAFNLSKFRGSTPFFKTSADLWEAIYPEGSLKSANALHYLGACLYRSNKAEEALPICLRSNAIREKLLPPNHCDHLESQRLIGNVHLSMGHYSEAIEYYQQALIIANACAGPESLRTADVLGNLGKAYLRDGDFDKSLAFLEKALLIRQKKLTPNHVDISDSYMDIGELYKKLGQFDKALFYYDNALEIYRNNQDKGEINVAYAYNEISQYFLARKEYATAETYLNKGNEIMVRMKLDSTSAYSFVCAQLGNLQMGLKNTPKAIEWYEKAVTIWELTNQYPNTQLGAFLTFLGRARLNMENFPGALAEFEKIERVYAEALGPKNDMSYVSDTWKGNTYRKWYLKTGQDSLLEIARTFYRSAASSVGQRLIKTHTATGKKKVLAESMPILERTFSAEVLALKSRPTDPGILENAWHLSESVHAYLLHAASQEANARHYAGIPDSELNRDSLLQAQIVDLGIERQSLLENGLRLTDPLILAKNADIFSKQEESEALRGYFEQKYPDYFRLKYELETSSLQKTQALLSPQQTLLEYFIGDFEVFIFVVQHDSSRVIAIPRDSNFPINDWIKALREGITGYHTSEQKTPELYVEKLRQYADAAQKLYEKLIAPVAASLRPELIIVPFEGLAQIPFEALLSEAPRDLGNFGTYPFLLKKHSVQYAYSATMLHQMTEQKHRQKPTEGLLAFAPFYDNDTTSLALRLRQESGNRQDFSPLPNSGEELLRIKSRFGAHADLFLGKDANKKRFQENAAKYRVLHLATHGKSNPAAGEFSYLAFADHLNPTGNDLLSVAEMYNLPINADLVVLSACETGIGEQQRGEGVLSLARAFAYAGAKSIVASLWSVNDRSTMLIMDNFYGELKSGKPKNIALANAKLNYLQQNPGLPSHPFFWAAFVGLGDMGRIK